MPRMTAPPKRRFWQFHLGTAIVMLVEPPVQQQVDAGATSGGLSLQQT